VVVPPHLRRQLARVDRFTPRGFQPVHRKAVGLADLGPPLAEVAAHRHQDLVSGRSQVGDTRLHAARPDAASAGRDARIKHPLGPGQRFLQRRAEFFVRWCGWGMPATASTAGGISTGPVT